MEVISNIQKFKRRFKKPVVAIGVFDGLHVGHQRLIRFAVERARRIHGTAIVMTFSPHPVAVLHPNVNIRLIISLEYRLKLLEQMGVTVCVVIPFTKKFAQLSPQSFMEQYLVKHIGAVEVIVGDDFRFGKDRVGTFELFRQAAERGEFKVHAIKAIHGGRKLVSSTKIRELILGGKLKDAETLLRRPVSVLGRVIRGEGRGHQLGFPTANIKAKDVVLPPQGVYIARIIIGNKKFTGVVNLGHRPSFSSDQQVFIEAHIFDFNQKIYGSEILVEFLKKIRPEKKFASPKSLIAQIKRDVNKARQFFS